MKKSLSGSLAFSFLFVLFAPLSGTVISVADAKKARSAAFRGPASYDDDQLPPLYDSSYETTSSHYVPTYPPTDTTARTTYINPGGYTEGYTDEYPEGYTEEYPEEYTDEYPEGHETPVVTDQHKVIREPQGLIFSPLFPGQYGNNQHLSWRLVTDPGQKILLTLFTVSLECDYDNLIIYDGPDATYPEIAQYCSLPKVSQIKSTSNEVYITFWSDYSVKNTGFILSHDIIAA
ncbi:deleted in malignant brain tumors 1 protein-like [Biomphalaria glabrata]|uniref:Deleted in malignant brain tumors 1 protein-like n=1 Tax=Biomphalaria glabrata TaxID=6526 RepID=A0A9W2YC68_BIOGL|nr:deleted in malignant brain tumors 1 protein-like [Biomphalaria glabrata]